MDLELSIINFNRIAAEIRAKSPHADIMLASKGVPKKLLSDFIKITGHKIFGENYIQDVCEKWGDIRRDFPDIKLHFIGRIQSGNIKKIVETCDVIESVESVKQLEKIRHEAGKIGRNPQCFAQINIGNEPQKGGFDIKYLAENRGVIKNFDGLMCIPPPQNAFLYFFAMSQFAKKHGIKRISMGMSADYLSALAFGATEVRIGSAIFGKRKPESNNE